MRSLAAKGMRASRAFPTSRNLSENMVGYADILVYGTESWKGEEERKTFSALVGGRDICIIGITMGTAFAGSYSEVGGTMCPSSGEG